ncbi:MAG: hypothetical protein ACK2UF_21920, partial [Candidatus Promineifilaceae bacterium]
MPPGRAAALTLTLALSLTLTLTLSLTLALPPAGADRVFSVRCGPQPRWAAALLGAARVFDPGGGRLPGADEVHQRGQLDGREAVAEGGHAGVRPLAAVDD